ncbi:MAG: PHP domain-containing protein [Burkholderiaceae bacterium]
MVPHDLNVDLHMHSTASDGTLSPEALVARGAANGVQIMALTDHDTLDGLARARAAAADYGVRFFNGVEISVTWGGETLHMVGLDFDDQHPALAGSLRQVAASRFERARAMDQGLMAAGLPSIFEEAMAYAGNPNLIGRAHFARAMVARGICSHMQAVFHPRSSRLCTPRVVQPASGHGLGTPGRGFHGLGAPGAVSDQCHRPLGADSGVYVSGWQDHRGRHG